LTGASNLGTKEKSFSLTPIVLVLSQHFGWTELKTASRRSFDNFKV